MGGVCAVGVTPGLGLGLHFAACSGRGVAAAVSGCFAVVLGGGRVLGFGAATGLEFGQAADVDLAGMCCGPALPVAGSEAAEALAVAGAPAVETGSGAIADGVAGGLGGCVLDEGVVMEVDEVVVVVEVVESAAEQMDIGDGGGSRAGSDAEETDMGDGRGVPDGGGGRWLLGPVGNEAEGVVVGPPTLF